MKDWLLLLIPGVVLFVWYWAFWRKFDPTSNPDRSNSKPTNDQLLAGYQLRQSGNKRYIKSTTSSTVKKPGGGRKKAAVKKSAARKKGKR